MSKLKFIIKPEDIMDTDETLSIIIYKILKKFKKINDSYPETEKSDVIGNFKWNKKYPSSKRRWKYILKEMIYGFKKYEGYEDDQLNSNENYDKSRGIHGRQLFIKYFDKLWN